MSVNQVEHLNANAHQMVTLTEPIHDSNTRLKLPHKPFSVKTLQKRSKKKHHHPHHRHRRDDVNENELLNEEQLFSKEILMF